MKPLAPVSTTTKILLGLLFFILFFAGWAWATLGGYVSKTFLADPITMIDDGYLLLTKHGFLFDIGMTIWRVIGGFVLAAVIAVPLGVLMGAYKPIEAFLEPGREVLLAHDGDEVATLLEALTPERARAIGQAALRRVLAEHTYLHRADQVEAILEGREVLV